MSSKTKVPYGSWRSPITSDLIVAETVGLGDIALDGDDTYWLESRPSEAGRVVVVRHSPAGEISDVTPAAYSVASRVHEYGGGAFTVHAGVVYFVNLKDQQIYQQLFDGEPQALTVNEGRRYADLVFDPQRQRLYAICEDHSNSTADEPSNSLVAIDAASGVQTVLASGEDFYTAPALSADGKQLAWLSWNHPNMPWDGTTLWLASFTDKGALSPAQSIAGSTDESVFKPRWDSCGSLYFISDRGGWWNLHWLRAGHIESLAPMNAEFGLPQWVFGMSTYAITDSDAAYCAYCQDGFWKLTCVTSAGGFEPIEPPYSAMDNLQADKQRLVMRAGSSSQDSAIVEFDCVNHTFKTLRRSSTVRLNPNYISTPQAISFPTTGGRTAHAFFYPPASKDQQAASDERPPLLVKGHGGPTSATSATLNLGIQYWTSRGFAVVDVNYGGSTGFGRDYRQQLDGQWGVVDVDDCVAAAKHLIAADKVDADRCAIRGNSAGGYTTLAALAFHDVFSAGASYYGVSDLETLATDTHKFESRYLDRLIGPYPETRELYQQRSPINHIEGLSAPAIFFQGLEDKVVPPNQAEKMVAALRAKGIPVAYVSFPGERHGFRQAATIKRALEAELYFYGRVFGFEPADELEPVLIENL